MKKVLLVLCLVMITFSFSSCAKKEYKVGDIGPAGGYIFYDKGSYSNGWRYLEAAPADLRVVDGKPTVDKSDPQYSSGIEEFVFGYYRKSFYGNNLFVNGMEDYNEKCTGQAVGTGEKNTKLLVKAMGTSTYYKYEGSYETYAYAAKLCSDLVYNGFDDWFLPSRDELALMKRYKAGIDGSACYWSSSEHNILTDFAYVSDGGFGNRGHVYRVRPVRAF